MHLPAVGSAILAFDIGGTDTKSALVDEHGRVLDVRRSATPRGGNDPARDVVAEITDIAQDYQTRHGIRPAAVGLSVPGLVTERTGIAHFSANLGWRDAPVKALAEASLGLPVAFGHDVRAAGLAEQRLGAARGYDSVVVLAIGTGLASALVFNSQLYLGSGFAGEIGHTQSDPHGEHCPCGAVGCLETIASAGAITRRYEALSGHPVAGARDVLAASARGDEVATLVWSDAVWALARSLASLVAVVAPDAIVLGGGLARAGDALLTPLAQQLDGLLSFHRRPPLLLAALADDAGLLGTAMFAQDLVLGATPRLPDHTLDTVPASTP
ncbi:MAG: hypothetical protein B5766_11920 [Candidatus Lumbricidophila eiseniae]|uniref:Sugar kinase n=1 Tax=Candidatus Lumbricidiphila eiseniae TaxID=1969409 RepID=A0A2A6FNZ1_9MICO|nr:MAG: hypothetical protein B5766_11920 [Candidatus Lumbricidophila eiseniae]